MIDIHSKWQLELLLAVVCACIVRHFTMRHHKFVSCVVCRDSCTFGILLSPSTRSEVYSKIDGYGCTVKLFLLSTTAFWVDGLCVGNCQRPVSILARQLRRLDNVRPTFTLHLWLLWIHWVRIFSAMLTVWLAEFIILQTYHPLPDVVLYRRGDMGDNWMCSTISEFWLKSLTVCYIMKFALGCCHSKSSMPRRSVTLNTLSAVKLERNRLVLHLRKSLLMKLLQHVRASFACIWTCNP